jgi:hypothetical protein
MTVINSCVFRFLHAGPAVVALLGVMQVAFAEEAPSEFPQRMTAKDLMLACASSSLTDVGRQRRRYCAGFVSGVEEGARILRAQQVSAAAICLPPRTSDSVLASAYTRYASKGGRELERPAAELVLEALSATYPCSK